MYMSNKDSLIVDGRPITIPLIWTRIEDSLPDTETDILTYCVSHGGKNTCWEKDERYFAIDRFLIGKVFRTDLFFNAHVTHWMHLPNPPIEKGKNL